VWEEPEPNAIYVIAADPAFGHDDECDRSAIQVLKCYADGLDQVAEYAWPLITTNHFAWVIASLAGWYAGASSDIYLIVELNGPGDAVWTELKQLRHRIENGPLPKEAEEAGIRDFFRNVKNYFYWRSDSMSPSRSEQWRTFLRTKIWALERLRDFVSNGMLHIRSFAVIEEMSSVSREGDKIKAQGRKKDDRVMALAIGVRMWEDRIRRMMITQGRTRSYEEARQKSSPVDIAKTFSTYQIDQLMNKKSYSRGAANARAGRVAWRYR
jgi:hypothetical protein